MKTNEVELFERLVMLVPQMSTVSINEYKRAVFLKDEEGRVLCEYNFAHEVVRFANNLCIELRDIDEVLAIIRTARFITSPIFETDYAV